MLLRRLLRWGLLCGILAGGTAALADTERSRESQLLNEMRESVERVPVQVQDALGRTVDGVLAVTVFRPPGAGPFPLVLINHGRDAERREKYPRLRFESAARYFLRKGFAVAVPMRLGYGELAAVGDPESSLTCTRPRYVQAAVAAGRQVQAVVAQLARAADIDASRVVLVGQSVGGLATLAATAMGVPGQVAAIAFSPGHGGRPDLSPGYPCDEPELRELFAGMGRRAAKLPRAVPSLWLHTENDRYFSPTLAQGWAQAYRAAGAPMQQQVLPAFSDDGHRLFVAGNDIWQPLVDEFLHPLGFGRAGALMPPLDLYRAAAQYPPALEGPLLQAYQRFLSGKAPRAFAMGAGGRWGIAWGDDAKSRALAHCNGNMAADCRLYAVDDALVQGEDRVAPALAHINPGFP
ncbi:alpha/beta hydrolase family protein [Roseateles sp. BYS180W]|uniref:Alpha/beta hydrolase family protein n=1 Tax=Roseateles rivi TaxID=3299028 RepID=A0ABW7FWS8_9BURK